jgi:hypothetical protein
VPGTTKAKPGRLRAELRVAIFVDYENIRRRLKSNFQQDVSPVKIAKALREIAALLGEFRFGKFYGDWSLRPVDARHVEAQQFKAEFVGRTPGGKDRSDAAMLVELGDQADAKDFDLALIATGDADFSYAIRKLREKGKRTAVAAVSIDAARELLTVADQFFPIEKHLNLEFAPASSEGDETAWRPFVARMLNLEARLPFVVRNYLRDKILDPSMGAGTTTMEKDAFIERAEKAGIVELAERDNPKLPGRKVTTIQLRRNHAVVAGMLLSA